ncbi:complex I subunit 5 family protein [Blastomonas aquatica]|uniref:NADH:quinone oxidoreductase/Mrp antiporter transmembrane domain-containing protein n=1 Tax=Blastomonas aquatica TaxID=1510276 RepID=A0ABQ1JI74_9SPHN|nr:proton-conducting transporter membrane subunit [Blastomonas aquatica]GGB69064.1 hypothetical protein GCM10010833_25360 [Blastomonas aquatica]
MNGVVGPTLPLAALIWPLLIGAFAALPPVRQHALRLLPLAPLPALWLAIVGVDGLTLAPDLLLGVTLGAAGPAALLFALTATLWFAAALHAQGSMANTQKPAVFTGFWCLTLAGNLGVFLAQDVATFYVAFAAVSLSAYFLVVHEATPAALHAGRVYAVLAILGEVCLLLAFVIGATVAGSVLIVDIRAALPTTPLAVMTTVLLVGGFGIKAGLMPLHVWLPLAHPAAPTPASAVLSGAIVKAGIIGLMVFLPIGTGVGPVLVVMGFFTAFAGALVGLRVRAPKAILAYSTISQIGLVIALVGTAIETQAADMATVAYYAFHHGLAKGALFLGVAVFAASGGRWRISVLIMLGLVALSVAGAPMTGGGLTKMAAKPGLGKAAELALTLSAVTTTLVLAWFLHRLSAGTTPSKDDGARPSWLVTLPTLALGLAAVGLPWWMWGEWSGMPADYPLRLASLWSAVWPVALGLALAGAMAATRWRAGTRDQADPLWWTRSIARATAPLRTVPRQMAGWRGAVANQLQAAARVAATRIVDAADTAERTVLAWRISGLTVLAAVLIVVALIGMA